MVRWLFNNCKEGNSTNSYFQSPSQWERPFLMLRHWVTCNISFFKISFCILPSKGCIAFSRLTHSTIGLYWCKLVCLTCRTLNFSFLDQEKWRKIKNLKQWESVLKNEEKYETSKRANEEISYLIYVVMRTETKMKNTLDDSRKGKEILHCILFQLYFPFLK